MDKELKIFKKLKDGTRNCLEFIFNIFIAMIQVYVIITLIFGSMASMLLLLKLYPELGATLLVPYFLLIGMIWEIIMFLLLVGICLIVFVLILLISSLITEEKIKINNERKRNREKFISEIVSKIKKSGKKGVKKNVRRKTSK